jgi:hypothetical protein
VAPTPGGRFFLELPYLHAERFQIVFAGGAQADPESLDVLLLDLSGAHTAHRLMGPAHVLAVWRPLHPTKKGKLPHLARAPGTRRHRRRVIAARKSGICGKTSS